MSSHLSPARQLVLHRFIETFLPPRGNKRKNTRNELGRVHLTLDRVMLKYFDFGVTRDQVLVAFEAMGYTIFSKKGVWHTEKKSLVPAASESGARGASAYDKDSTVFIYVDVEAPTVAILWLTTIALSAGTSPIKLLEQESLVERIRAFKQELVFLNSP